MRKRCILLLPLTLACTGEDPRPAGRLHVGAKSLDFGRVPADSAHTRRLDVTNLGPAPLEIREVRTTGGPFEAFPSMLTIAPDEAAEIRVRFSPDRSGLFDGVLGFDSNDAEGSTVTVSLAGTGFCTGLGCPPPLDAGVHPDAEAGPDAGSEDTGSVDTGEEDSGMPDAGTRDAGTPDAGTPDAGPPDTGMPDAGLPDTGMPDAGFSGLAAHYRFEATSGALIDDSGNGNDGVPSAAGLVRGVAGKVGNAVRFEGNVGQFVVPADPSLDGAQALTIELFLNLAASGTQMTILGRGINTSDDAVLLSTSCGNIYVVFSRSGVDGTASATTNCNSFSTSQWVHVAVVNDGVFLTVYLDGEPVVQRTGGFLGPIASPLYIGRKDPGVEPLNGLVDELRWWTVARTQAEICDAAGGTMAGGSCVVP